MASENDVPTCTNCKKPETDFPTPLKRCAKCQSGRYCSRDCQKADWKSHKKSCGSKANNSQPGPGLGRPGPGFGSSLPASTHFSTIDMNGGRVSGASSSNPFSADALQLDALPEKEAFARIIDSYRMRIEDEYKFRGDASGLYDGEDPLPDFQRFLRKAEERGGCLPKWWSEEKSVACQELGMSGAEWSDLNCKVEKSDVMQHYGDSMMPLKLRVLAEKITGSNVMARG